MPRIHPTAIVEPHAELAADVEIGPFCLVAAGVRVGAGSRLVGHVVIVGDTTLGEGNVVHPFAVLGGAAQVRKGHSAAEEAPRRPRLVIGDHNVVREGVTINVSSGEGTTAIGSQNLFMAGCHVAHDVVVGSHNVIANAVQLAGHVLVSDWVTFGGLAGVAQHVRIGEGAFVAAGAMCERDVPPFVIVQGDRARVRALNVVGLERRGAPKASILALRRAVRKLWARAGAEESRRETWRSFDRSDPWVARLVGWLEDPARDVRPSKRSSLRT